MAGGAYRGLTIRIGADTKSLASGLRGANSAIHKTQTELRKLAQAAKVDPGNTKIASAQIGAMANQAMDAAAKMDTLNKSIADMGQQKSLTDKNKSIRELAEETENAGLSAEMAKERYNNLTSDLSKEFNKINKQVKDFYTNEKDITDEKQMPLISFKNLDDMDSIESVLSELTDAGRMTEEQMSHLMTRIEALKDSWHDADASLKDANMVQSLKNAENEATRMDATVSGLSKKLAELKVKNDFAERFKDVDKRIELASTAADAAKDRLKGLNDAMKLDPTSIKIAAERYKALGDATDASKAKLEAINQKIAALKSDGIDKQAKSTSEIAKDLENAKTRYAEVTQSVSKFAGELENAKRAYQDLVDNPDADRSSDEFKEAEQAVERYEEALEEAKRVQDDAFDDLKTANSVAELDKLENEARETEQQIKHMGDVTKTSFGADAIQAASAFGDVMRDIGDKVIESSREIDSAFRDLRKTFDASEQDYSMLYDAAMKYSQTHVTSADSMLEMEAIAAQVGIGMEGGAEAIQHFAEVAGNLDVATDIDAETIALQMGQIVNVMDDLREDNVERFGDALVRLGNTMPAQESSIMQITQRLAAVGSVANFTTPELMGWAAAIAGTGQRSEAAATGISNTITAIQKAVGSGGDSLNTFAEVAGMSAEQFADAWRTSPTEALKSFLEGLDGLGDESLQKLEDLDITGVRQTQTLLALAQTTDTVTSAIDKANDAWGDEAAGIAASGDAAQEAEKKAAGFSGSLSKMENSVQVLAATFGEGLAPYIDMVAGGAQTLTNIFSALGPNVTGAVAAFGALTGGLGAVYPIASKVIESLKTMGTSIAGGVTQGIAKLAIKFGDASTPIMGLGSAIMSLGASGAIFMGGFGAVALAVIGTFIKDAIDAKQHADNLGGALKGMTDNASGIDEVLGGGAKAVKDYGEAARDAKVDVDALVDSVNQHNQRNEETRSSAEEQIAMLGQYKSVIDEMAGAGDASADDMAKLQWALDGLAEATGETYTKEQVLTGQFKDEAGEIHNTADAIDKLIAKKQEEARVNALTEMYTDTLKTQLEAQKAVNDAEQERQDYIDESIERYKELGNYQNDDQVVSDLEAHSEKMKELNQNLKETQEIYDGTTKEAEYYAQAMGEAAMAQYEYATVSEDSAKRSQQGWNYAAQQMGTDVETLKQSLFDAGLSAEQVDSVTGEHFAHMAAESGGSLDQMIAQIANYNAQEFEDKHSVFLFDEEGNLVTANNKRVEWNSEAGQWEYVKTGIKVSDEDLEITRQAWQQFYDDLNGKEAKAKVTADTSGAEEANQAVEELPEDKEVKIETTADTSGAEETKEAVDSVDDTTTKKIETEADTSGVDETNEKIESVPKETESTVTITTDTAGVQEVTSTLESIPKEINVSVSVNTGNLQAATTNVANYNKVAGQLRTHKVSANVTGNAATSTTPTTNIKNLNSAMRSMSNGRADATATGNAINKATADNIWNLVNAINHLHDQRVTITTVRENIETTKKHAKGGIFPGLSVQKVPMNAEGFIAKSATMTNYGYVGENGAEGYFGNTLVPLTNRKYSTPWVNDTSDAIVRKLAKAGAIGGNTANVSIYVDGSGDPEAVAHAIADRLRIVMNAG